MPASDDRGASYGAGSAGRILVVEDDLQLRAMLTKTLRKHGFIVRETADGTSALEMLRSEAPDLLIADIGLPGIDGLELVRKVRSAGDTPVIFVTGRAEETDRVVGLELGADDYLVKPVYPRELVARVNAVLRRARPQSPTDAMTFGTLSIDPATREVTVQDVGKELTVKEFDLLAFMAASPKRVYSRELLLRHVWGSGTEWQDPSTVTEHIRRLRQKIEADPSKPRWIKTVRGAGYRFEP